jgi:hypothetical protein
MNPKLLSLALLCTVVAAHAAPTQVYKWTDANGVVHYSEAPPPPTTPKVETVHVSGDDRAHAAESADAGSGDKPKDATAANASPANAAVPNTPENRAKECQMARNNLTLLQSNAPVNVVGADGKTQPMEDSSRQARIEGVKDQIALLCQ